jgi:hypothetical protein
MTIHTTETQQLVWPLTVKRQWYRRRELYKSETTSERRHPQPYSLYEHFANLTFYAGGAPGNSSHQYPTCENIGYNSILNIGNKANSKIAPFDGIAWNRCRKAYIEKVHGGVSASIGAALAECNEALGMVATRATQLYHMARSLKRGDIRGFTANLASSDAKRVRRQYSKFRNGVSDLSSVWLEAWFGWVPAVKDIYDAYRVLTRDFGSNYVNSTGRSTATDTVYSDNSTLTVTCQELYISYSMYGRFWITNPNLLLASELGLTNPASVLWEVTPFSFLVDWFSSFGDWIDSLDDELGWDFDPSSTFYKRIATARQRWIYHPSDARFAEHHSVYGKCFDRVPSAGIFPPIRIQSNRLDRLSVTRGVTSVALLVGALDSIERSPRRG